MDLCFYLTNRTQVILLNYLTACKKMTNSTYFNLEDIRLNKLKQKAD